LVAIAGILLLLTACSSKIPLYSALSEHDADDMLALLEQSGINADKVVGKTGASLLVSSDKVPQAMGLLDAAGLPRPTYATMADLFAKQGLISSPTEENIRYLYGVTQELSLTLSQIDGVVGARVHVVLPDNSPVGDQIAPSSAAVLIRYAPNTPVDELVPKIKQLVVNSIQGLTYDRVSVILVKNVPIIPVSAPVAPRSQPGAASLLAGGAPLWLLIGAGVGLISLIGNGVLAIVLFRRNFARRATGDTASALL
jgi:type III secretion protein J